MTTFNSGTLRIFSLGLFCFFWIADTILNVYIFKNGQSFLSSFFTPTATELWMRLSVGISIIVFFFYTQKSSIKLQEQIDELEYLVTTDPTTLLFNKRKLYELLDYEIEKSNRYKLDLSVIFCDIDNASALYKKHQEPVIKKFLRNFSLQLATCLRKSDLIARWGEEGFVILVTNKTAQDTKQIAEKIRKIIEEHDFQEVGKVTASFGVTQFVKHDNKVTIIQRANNALNIAKQNNNSIEVIL